MSGEYLKQTIDKIKAPNQDAMKAAFERQQSLAKPPGSLGVLEELSIKVAGMTGKIHNKPNIKILNLYIEVQKNV